MEDIEIQMDEIKDFVNETYTIVLQNSSRNSEEGCYARDFYSQMIPQNNAYWMSVDHPVAVMLSGNNFRPLSTFTGEFGDVVIYAKDTVETCVKSLVEYCVDYGLKVLTK